MSLFIREMPMRCIRCVRPVEGACTEGASGVREGVRNKEEKFCYGKKETVFRQ